MDLLHSDLPAAFEDLLRDALLHLYDPGHLHGHRLLGYAPTDQLVTQPQGKALRQALLDAMEGPSARRRRAYRLSYLAAVSHP